MGVYLSLKKNVETLDLVKQHASSSEQRSPPLQLQGAEEGAPASHMLLTKRKSPLCFLSSYLANKTSQMRRNLKVIYI